MKNTDQLRAAREKLCGGGGRQSIDAQHAKGKLTARERLGLLFDPGTFTEMDAFVRHRCTDFGMEGKEAPCEGVVTGYGRVNGRLVYAFSQDFTVLGGSLGEYHAEKIAKVQDHALKNGVPLVGLMDSGGARIQEGVNALYGFGKIFRRSTAASGVIPQISAIMGPCAGGATYAPAITDFVFMVDKTSHMFITGPEVIRTVTGEEVTFDQLGGADVHNRKSGAAHFIAQSDRACLESIRGLLSYLPANNREEAPAQASPDPPERRAPELYDIVPDSPNRAYDMKRVVGTLVDGGDYLEVQPLFAPNILTCFARMGGGPVGVVANQPCAMAGCLDADASDKAARFIRFCDAFNIPLLTLVDVPGFLPGVRQEHGGIIRHGAKMLYAYSEATVPKVTVVLRKAYGGAYIAMCCQALGADAAYAWPDAEIAVMGAAGAANIVFKKEIQSAPDPQAKREEKIAGYQERFSNPYIAAGMGYLDDVIDPADTRRRVIDALGACRGKQEAPPWKKHGNIPL